MIRELSLPDNCVFADASPENKVEFEQLLDTLKSGDTLLVRSIIDMESDFEVLQHDILPYLSELKIELHSIEEPFLCGIDYLKTVNQFVNLVNYYNKQKRKIKYQKAVKEQKVGRPSKSDKLEKAIRLYESGKYKVTEISNLTGVSKSALYKHLKKNKK